MWRTLSPRQGMVVAENFRIKFHILEISLTFEALMSRNYTQYAGKFNNLENEDKASS